MESYKDKLVREVKEIGLKCPEISQLINAVLEVRRMGSQEFDYEIERTHLMYSKCDAILKGKISKTIK